MAFCAWCGNHVPQASYALCPRCGNHTNGAQRVAGGGASGGQAAGLVIGLVIGGFVLIAVIGILAAIAIPNLLTAMQRAKQKRSMADMRSVAAAVEAYATDNNKYPPASSYAAELEPVLMPTYIKQLPKLDGWGTAIRYECWPAEECREYAVGSAGGDKNFEHQSLKEYAAGTKTSDFDCDLVFANGKFVQYPEGVQGGAQ
jgi:general secretion pathway protein G